MTTNTENYITNCTFDEIQVGDSAHTSRQLTQKDIETFAVLSGDVNPAHVDPEYAKESIFHEVIAHGMWGASLISAVLGTQLPGPGTIYLSQSLQFLRPVVLGDVITASVTVSEKNPEKKQLELDCKCVNQKGKEVIAGTAKVLAPVEKIHRPRVQLHKIHLE